MPSWHLSPCGTTIIRDLPPTGSHCANQDEISRLEVSGLHVTACLCFNSSALLQNNSIVIFSSRYAVPSHPRGYLRTELRLPQSVRLSPAIAISYDGVKLNFQMPSVSMSIFVSPQAPTVWLLFHYDQPQGTSEPCADVLQNQNGHVVTRFITWLSPTTMQIAFSCVPTAESLTSSNSDLEQRQRLVNEWTSPIAFQCPDGALTAALHFAKIRMCEAVVHSEKLGMVHSPGGAMFYGGVWCNDQAEYAGPLLVTMGESGSTVREAALNSYRVIANHFEKSIPFVPFSVEIDGGYIGSLDRGDAAMYAWGAAQVVLALSDDPAIRTELVPHIRFCCEILQQKIHDSPNNVVTSQSDELEGRFSTSHANLSVNCLAILAFQAAAEALRDANDIALAESYEISAENLRQSVHTYFAQPDEPRRYAYYKGCIDARGWACLTALAQLPDGVDALHYSMNELWGGEGVLVSENATDIWDRCTLYAIRAAFIIGATEEALEKLSLFVDHRFFHSVAAPYPVECNTSYAQLSAESALLVRVITEGLLGMCACHGRAMNLKPTCPEQWGSYVVNKVRYGGVLLNFSVELVQIETPSLIGQLAITVTCDSQLVKLGFELGASLLLRLPKQNAPMTLELVNEK